MIIIVTLCPHAHLNKHAFNEKLTHNHAMLYAQKPDCWILRGSGYCFPDVLLLR